MPRFVLASLLFFFSALFAVLAPAQDASTGAIRGTVLDPDGRVVEGATVVIVNTANADHRSAPTNANGYFSFDLLPPGDYTGRAEIAGLSPQVAPISHLDIGGTLQMDFRLSVAGTKEAVTVSGAPPMVETQPSALSAVIDEQAIGDLPLNGRRFTDLSLLAPGVTQDPRGLTSSSNGDLAFGGIRGYQSSYLVDGADNNNGFFSQARGRYRAPYQFSNETVQEFRVSSNTYGAELGRAGGAVVNVVTKSGSNHMHGSAFYFFRDNSFAAQQAFLDFKPPARQQQFGFTAGGPIQRNKTFFFVGYDQHIYRIPTVVRYDNGGSVLVPQKGTEPLRHGDYEASDQAQVFAAAAQLNQLIGTFPSNQLGNTAFAKVDTTLSPRHHLSGRVNLSRYWGSNNVFFDPASPITTFALSNNGEEQVATESASVTLTSALSTRLISHLRVQFSRDDQQSFANSSVPRTRLYSILDGIGRSSILPRNTREHRLHLTDTLSFDTGRHSWKVGGDALLTWTYNFFPSMFGGEFYFDNMRVDPWTFEPMHSGMYITPLRAYAHQVPRYYIQNFGNAVSHPDTNEYAAFLQDSIRLTHRLAASLGLRYDLQTFSTKELVSNPLWPASGQVPVNDLNFAPRVGIAYSIGDQRPLVVRAGYGVFYTRIPQIYLSTVTTDNGINSLSLFLDNMDQNNRTLFPTYPTPLVQCGPQAAFCAPPASLVKQLGAEVSAFAPNFQTPRVQQASLNVEREIRDRLAAGISYIYAHGQNMIRARDVNLPAPTNVTYPVYDETGNNFLGSYYDIPSFSAWQLAWSLNCAFPPCINPVARPIPQLQAINQFESVASSVYHGATLSVRRRMPRGLYFRLAYTYGRATDDGQDALVAGRPVTVQNSYATSAERGPSVTDQRNRVAFSWIAEPKPFGRDHNLLAKLCNDWKLSGVVTYGSGRPFDARVFGDPNQDGNTDNDRLPGYSRNAFTGPDYATTDLRLSRQLFLGARLKLQLMMEVFNLMNRDNQRVNITDDGFQNTAAQFTQGEKTIGINTFPAYYQRPANFLKATSAYAPRQIQLAARINF